MPLYEFKCPGCREKFEQLCQSGSDSFTCPTCGEEAKRVYSTFCSSHRGTGGGAAGCGG